MAFVSRKSMRNNYRGTNSSNQQQSTRKDTTSEAVTNREFVVICADKSGRVATFAENTKYVESYSRYSNDTKLNMFEQLRDVLEAIPCHTEELLDKQVAIYVPSAITGNLGDMYRSDKYESCQEIMLEVDDMLRDRALNCFIVDIRGSQATIVQNAYEFVKEESKRANAQADGVEYKAPSKSGKASAPEMSKEDKARLAELKTKLAQAEDDLLDADDDEAEAKLEKKIAKLQSMISRLLANAGQKAETKAAESAQQPVEDEFADTDL